MNQGLFIKELLKQNSIKLIDVAKEMGISRSSLSNKLSGKRIFKKNEIEILLKLLNMTYEKVFNVKEIKIANNDQKIISINNKEFLISNKAAKKIMNIINLDTEVI